MSEIRYFTDGEQATADTLNRPIKDLALLASARSWAQVKKDREDNRVMYPVSGQISGKGSELELVESGATASNSLLRTNVYTTTTEGINNNCLMQAMDEGDSCCVGRYGDKSFNIAGQFFKTPFRNGLPADTHGVSRGGGSYNGAIFFPKPSNSASEPLLRMDLVGIEMWEEKVSERGVVFWGGCVQSVNGYSTLAAADIEESYSSFFLNEELDSDKSHPYMKCYHWESISDAIKSNLIKDPIHNLYHREGELWQTRFRWRILKDYKSKDTKKIIFGEKTEETGVPFNNRNYSQSAANVNVEGEYVLTVQGHSDKPGGILYQGMNSTYTAAKIRNDQGVYISRNGQGESAYFMPIFAVQRRNYGAYHPFLNPHGTSAFSKRETWIEANPGSTVECFDRTGYVSTFENNFTITGNPRSFLETSIFSSNFAGATPTYALKPALYDNTYPGGSSHYTFLSRTQQIYSLTWELPDPKVLRKVIIQVSNDWATVKRSWIPDAYKIFGSNTGDFSGEETELVSMIDGNNNAIGSNGIQQTKRHPYSEVITITNTTSFKFYRFSHTSNVQSGMDKIEFFEDASAVSNFVINGIPGLSLMNGNKEYKANISKAGYYISSYKHIKNSFYSDSAGIPLNVNLGIFINGSDTGKTIKFSSYSVENVPSGSYFNYDRFCTGDSYQYKADFIQNGDILDLRYILSAKSGLSQ